MPRKKSPAHFAKQAQEAYELSIAGYSQRQIAEKMGVALATVQRRLNLYIENTTMPKAEEYRTRQIARLEIYIRSLWSQVNMGDPKAVMAAVRTEERIAKLMGTDAATAFTVTAKDERMDDKSTVLRLLRGIQEQRGEDVSKLDAEIAEAADRHAKGLPPMRRKRPRTERPSIANTYDPKRPVSHNPANEFAKDSTFHPHEVQEEAVHIAEDVEPAPRPRRKTRSVPNPAQQFLRDADDD